VAILRFVRGKTLNDYEQDELLRSGVERKFEIIGEALNRIGRDNPIILDQLREHRTIVSFRNILAHGYDSIDNRIVWGIIEEDLGKLLSVGWLPPSVLPSGAYLTLGSSLLSQPPHAAEGYPTPGLRLFRCTLETLAELNSSPRRSTRALEPRRYFHGRDDTRR
jgi:uncharacterized protein with HEPN domain